jgi:hypothetical protein
MGAPPVFVSRFVQTHVRVYRRPLVSKLSSGSTRDLPSNACSSPSDSPSSDAFRLSPVLRMFREYGLRLLRALGDRESHRPRSTHDANWAAKRPLAGRRYVATSTAAAAVSIIVTTSSGCETIAT